MAVKTYDPGEVTIIFGPVVFSGFADDSVVTVEHNEDTFTLKVGVDGKGTRTRNRNESGRVTVRLMQSSMTNDLLSSIAQLDRQAGQGVFPLMVKDGSGRSLYAAESAWIVKDPAGEFAKEAGAREWILETDKLVAHTGGN